MTKVTFESDDGDIVSIEAQDGVSLMENAVKHGVRGIEADCGGACACATCHVYIDEAFREKMTAPSDMEEAMLDFVDDRRDNSRLSCQIEVTPSLDGITAKTPKSQY